MTSHLSRVWRRLAERGYGIPQLDKFVAGDEVVVNYPNFPHEVRAVVTRVIWGSDSVMIRPEGIEEEAIIKAKYLTRIDPD